VRMIFNRNGSQVFTSKCGPSAKPSSPRYSTLSEGWSEENWADLMAAQGAFGTDFYDRSIFRPKHRAYYRSGRPII